MLYGVYLSTAGALAEEARQDVIANNLANVNTTGFKGDTAVFRARLAEALEKSSAAKNRRSPLLDQVGGGLLLDEVSFTGKNGPLDPSSSALDLGLQGDGFFRVSDGVQEFYTRDGRFQRSADGLLVTGDGLQVLDDRGRPIRIPLGELRVGERGDLSVDGAALGRLGLSGSLDPRQFEKVGANLYRHRGAGTAPRATPAVRQFYLERSTVSPIQEMVRMIQSQRAYETNVHMIRIQDATLERAANGIAKMVV
ncbi:MAG: flagellar hook-basal body protein [Planctomycetes bacterium]|nr:flagellar hook-basal body protein [Planctomycetota bacterium]